MTHGKMEKLEYGQHPQIQGHYSIKISQIQWHKIPPVRQSKTIVTRGS